MIKLETSPSYQNRVHFRIFFKMDIENIFHYNIEEANLIDFCSENSWPLTPYKQQKIINLIIKKNLISNKEQLFANK